MLTESDTALSEVTECYMDGTGTAGFSISAYNGPLTVTISAYNGIEPADLGGVATAAMAAACDAIHALDPDDDGDIDTGAGSDASASTDDNQMESATEQETGVSETATTEEQATEAAATETDAAEATATETAEQTGETAAQAITPEQLAEAVKAAVEAALAERTQTGEQSTEENGETAATEGAEAPAQVDEAALRAQIRDEIIAEARKNGTLTRKGLVEGLGEPEKPLHEMSDEEFRAYQQARAGLFFAHNPQ